MARVGSRFVVETGKVGHGGFVVARHEGQVVFVRHALPGERVLVEVTEDAGRFLRADAVEVLTAAADRVEPPCPWSGPGRCGGCDFQHVAVPMQRSLKAAVVREQLNRLAGLDVDTEVEALEESGAPAEPGLGWRTRIQWAVAPSGSPGLHKHRSHDVVLVDRCLIAHPQLPPVTDQEWPEATSVDAIVSGTGERLRLVTTTDGAVFADGPTGLHERAIGRTWQVTGPGFWQVHPAAADTLARVVLAGLEPQPGERALDLYAGVGLFSAALAGAVGLGGAVTAVESSRQAVADARVNLADLPQVSVLRSRVDRALGGLDPVDLVVLDPPRTGAKRAVVSGIAGLRPRAVAYVACDPAALGRDVALFTALGYSLASLRAFDLFPMTHHVECVALLEKTGSDLRRSVSR